MKNILQNGDWAKFEDLMFVKVVQVNPNNVKISYKGTEYLIQKEKLKKATDGDMMLWKLEHPDEKIGS